MKPTWVDIEVKHETPDAILCGHALGADTWIPKSQITDYSDDYDVGDTIQIEVPEWLALARDMI